MLKTLGLALAMSNVASPLSAMPDDDYTYAKEELGISQEEEQIASEFYFKDDRRSDDITKEVQADLESGNFTYLAIKLDSAINGWVQYSAIVLTRKGNPELAERLRSEYQASYRSYARSMQYLQKDVGDHPPFSDWVEEWCQKIEATLGTRLFELLHLDDIRVINYCVVVVFQPCGDARFPPIVQWGAPEYKLHFVPFAGTISYWIAWGVCTGATFGAGAIGLICSPIGEVCEMVIENRVAPPLSDRIYKAWVPNRCR